MDFSTLNEVFQETFDQPDLQVTPETTANDVVGWDSITHILLISAVELRFGIEFSRKEVMKFQTVGDLWNCVLSKL